MSTDDADANTAQGKSEVNQIRSIQDVKLAYTLHLLRTITRRADVMKSGVYHG